MDNVLSIAFCYADIYNTAKAEGDTQIDVYERFLPFLSIERNTKL